jgi:hypothetical protein
MTFKERTKRNHDRIFKPRILCECGWLNYKPSKGKEKYAKCQICGIPTVEPYKSMYKFKSGFNKARKKLEGKYETKILI